MTDILTQSYPHRFYFPGKHYILSALFALTVVSVWLWDAFIGWNGELGFLTMAQHAHRTYCTCYRSSHFAHIAVDKWAVHVLCILSAQCSSRQRIRRGEQGNLSFDWGLNCSCPLPVIELEYFFCVDRWLSMRTSKARINMKSEQRGRGNEPEIDMSNENSALIIHGNEKLILKKDWKTFMNDEM